jgi:nucleotide-binding universal stress UspA family protein
MYRKIMVGYAPDRHGDDALALARVLASTESAEEVVIVQAGHEPASADRLMTLAAGWPSRVSVSTRVVSGGSAARMLIATAESEGADLLVLGSSHRGFAGRLLAGTTADSILPEARWPVVIAPQGFEASRSLRKLGIAFDGSEESDAALRWGAEVASAFSAELRLVAIVQPPPPPAETWGVSVPAEAWDSGFAMEESLQAVEGMREEMTRELAAARTSVGRDDAETVVTVGDARSELREAAEDLDMLVVGSHKGGRVAGALMGSVSRGLAHSSPAPLAVVPSPHA